MDERSGSAEPGKACIVCAGDEVLPFAQVNGRFYWRCRGCEATFLTAEQRLSEAEERAYYGLHQNDPRDPRYRAFLARLTGHLLPRLAAGATGLDYGCGPGPTISAMLGERGYTVTDYDPLFAPDAAALARRYDFVTCTEVAEHFREPAREFARLDGLLRPGGWLGVMTGMLPSDAGFAAWHYRRDPTHIVFYKPATFACLAGRFRWRAEFPAPDIALFRKSGD